MRALTELVDATLPDARGIASFNRPGTITLLSTNGKVIQKNVELPKPTPGGLTGKEMAKGPIMFQGDHGPVAYRNIKITPLK